MKTIIAFAMLVVVLLSPVSAHACACCSEPGHYFNDQLDISEHVFGEFERIRFARTATLYLTAAGLEEDARGIDQPRETYTVTTSIVDKMLKFTFRTGAHTGTLSLPIPARIWHHSADIHDRKLSPGGGPLLYKEWRFEGDATGTGMFKDGTSSPAKYTLILQGRGNACDNAEDFSNWRLQVEGDKARFALYGKLVRPGRK